MKIGMLILVPAMFLATSLFFLQIPGENGMVSVTPTTRAAEPLDSQTAAATPSANGDDTPYSYVGTNKCKMCHLAEHRSWKKTKMAQTLETLKPGNAVEVKKKYGLDPAKDYSTDQGCLKCHTTGYDHEGGYVIPDPEDKKAVRRAKKLAGVGCESCHGPGSAYIDVFMDIFKSKRKYKVEELYAVGLIKMDAAVCAECHNDKSPTFDAENPFDFEKMKDEGTHEHQPLKQREN